MLQVIDRGDIKQVALTVPAAGANLSYTVPVGQRWNVLGLTLTLDTNATVADRQMFVFFNRSSIPFSACLTQALQTAGNIYQYIFAPGLTSAAAAVSDIVMVQMQTDLFLSAGDTITTLVSNLQAGDSIMDIYAQLESFIIP